MILHRVTGFITSEIIKQSTSNDAWALSWLERAQKAEMDGVQLMVVELPKNELIYCAGEGEIGQDIEPFLCDLDLIKEMTLPLVQIKTPLLK